MLSGDSEGVENALRDYGTALAACEVKRLAWERAWPKASVPKP